MVVGLLRTRLPFIDGSAAAFGFDEVLGGDLLGEHSVLFGSVTKDRKTTSIAHRDGESRVREGLPPVGVVDHVSDRSFAVDGRDSPVQADSVARAPFVFAEWVG